MMFCLVLHTSHHQQPEEVLVSVVSAGDDLMIHKSPFWVIFEPLLLLVVSDENKS